MTPPEFKKKWAKVTAKETSAYQSHFDDLCRLLGIAPPLEADPTGETFCYQKRVMKDAELFDLAPGGDAGESSERGFADVWKKGCFAREYKGKKKNLDEAYKQLLRYRESLLNPPLLVVCDFDRYIVRTNFNGTVQEAYEFTNEEIDDPRNWRALRSLFSEPDFVSLQLLLTLEKEIITCGTQLGFKLAPQVSVQQLRALEINPYAFELAQVSVQIGFLQWRRDNGFDNERSPVLQDLEGFQNEAETASPDIELPAGATPGQAALAWLLRRAPNIVVIPGTTSIAHLEENIAAAALALPNRT